MKYFSFFISGIWLVLFIALFFGYVPSLILVGGAFLVIAVTFFLDGVLEHKKEKELKRALEDFERWIEEL